MQTDKVLFEVMYKERLKPRIVCERMGRSPRFLDPYRYGGATPNTATLAQILDVCDYDLVARSRNDGTEFVIDPPTSD